MAAPRQLVVVTRLGDRIHRAGQMRPAGKPRPLPIGPAGPPIAACGRCGRSKARPTLLAFRPASTATLPSDDITHGGLLVMGVRGVEREVLRVLAEGEEAYDLHMLNEKLVHPMQGEDASPATSSSSSSPTTRARTQARRSGKRRKVRGVLDLAGGCEHQLQGVFLGKYMDILCKNRSSGP